MNKMITIIVPIYNAERYLSHCINSILSQTYVDFELLLINDGSTDNSLEICNDYARRDKRIKVISQNNSGVSVARNNGINKARGVFVSFVDADDVLTKDYLYLLYDNITKREVDLVCCGVDEIKSDGEKARSVTKGKDLEQSGGEVIRDFFKKGSICAVWGKLYKISIINEKKLSFDSRFKYAEDHLFVYMYMQNCKSVFYSAACLYKYRIDNEASVMNLDSMTGEFNKKRFYDDFAVFFEILEHVKKRFGKSIYKLGCARFFAVCKSEMLAYLCFDCEDKEILNTLKAKMRETLWCNLCYYESSLYVKFFSCVLTFMPMVMKPIVKYVVK